MTTWEIWLDDPFGLRLLALSPVSFSLVKSINKPGAFEITFAGNFSTNPVKLDGLVEFWRDGQWINTGMVRVIKYWQDSNGNDYISLAGPDLIDLLARRVIAGAAGSAETTKTDYADDMIKAIVTDNFGASAGAQGRNISAYLSVEADASLGYSMTKSFFYRNVLIVCQEIAQTSAENSKPIYFDIVPYVSGNLVKLRFETYLNQPGIDRTGTSQVIFGTNFDNISNVRLEYDFSEEITMAYAGGQGEGADRYISGALNTRYLETPYNRREAFTDARNESATAAVDAKAEQVVFAGAPVVRLSGNLLDIPPTRYGIEWSWGDKVIVQYRDIQVGATIGAISFGVDSDGNESIGARFQVEDSASYAGRLLRGSDSDFMGTESGGTDWG